MRKLATLVALSLVSLSCGTASTTDPDPQPTPSVPTYSVTAVVYYDENANGLLDASELVRVPGVEVVIGNASARTAARGQVAVTGIREGTSAVSVRPGSLPPYFEVAAQPSVPVPGTSEVKIPLTLPIGRNYPNLYLGYGDSITYGDGSSDGRGYSLKLQALLSAHLGTSEVRTWGRQGDTSAESGEAATVRKTLGWFNPAYTLILLGTNDWHECNYKTAQECYTIDWLRQVVVEVKAWRGGSLPVLGTLPPVNPNLAPSGRNLWYDQMNLRIKALGLEQGVAVADINAEFKAASSLPALFADDVHPNDAGYQAMAQAWFKAITGARSASSTAGRRLGFLAAR